MKYVYFIDVLIAIFWIQNVPTRPISYTINFYTIFSPTFTNFITLYQFLLLFTSSTSFYFFYFLPVFTSFYTTFTSFYYLPPTFITFHHFLWTFILLLAIFYLPPTFTNILPLLTSILPTPCQFWYNKWFIWK